jgi:hypothetical protein
MTLHKITKLCRQWVSAVVLNLWSADPWESVTPTHWVRDCLDSEINHFLVAPIPQHTMHILKRHNLQN